MTKGCGVMSIYHNTSYAIFTTNHRSYKVIYGIILEDDTIRTK